MPPSLLEVCRRRVNTLGNGNNWEDHDLISVLQIYGDETTRTGEYKYLEEMGYNVGNLSEDFAGKEVEKMRIDCCSIHSDMANFPIYNLHTDQSDETQLKAADLITGYWYMSLADYVDIPMKHRMSLVTIVYHVGTADYPDMDISEPQVYSKNNSVRFFESSRPWAIRNGYTFW